MKIELTQNKATLVDDKNLKWLNQDKWHVDKHGNIYYAVRKITIQSQDKKKNIKQKRKTIYMHRIIMENKLGRKLKQNEYIDHINGNGLDNRRNNLRLCDNSKNIANSNKQKNTSSIYKGVCWNKRLKKWISQIRFNKKTMHLGVFHDEIEAALAYNEIALKYFKEFAKINIIN